MEACSSSGCMVRSCMPGYVRGLACMPKVDRPGSLGHHIHVLPQAGCWHQAGLRQQAHIEQSFCSTRRNVRAAAAHKDNPQNVPDPEVMPDRSLSPEEAVAVQLKALQKNDHPWPNHGIQTMYEFAQDVGGMDRSIYFGPDALKDLYHFDHFMGLFQNNFGELIGAQGFKIRQSTTTERGNIILPVTVQSRDGTALPVRFVLRKRDVGQKEGCWMTFSLLQHEG